MIVIITRHGKASPYDALTQKGEDEVQMLGERLQEIVPETSVPIIVFSPTKRTKQTALLIQEALGGNAIERDAFDERGNIEKGISLIKSFLRKSDCVVVVTHLPHIQPLFEGIVADRWPELTPRDFAWGAHVLDLETGEYTPIDTDLLE